MKIQCYISAVVYVRNAEKSIVDFLKKIDTYFFNNFENYEIILVDDASSDNTLKMINENRSKFRGNIITLVLAWEHKIEQAMLAGTHAANGDYVFEFDSIRIDYPLDTLSELYNRSISGYDIVSAVPQNMQRMSSRLFYKFLNIFSYIDLSLDTEYLRIISRRALNRVFSFKQKIRYRKVLHSYTGLPKSKIGYSSDAKTKPGDMTLIEKVGFAVEILFSFSNIGIKIAQYFAGLFLIASLFIGLYVVFIYFYLEKFPTGWPTTNGFIALSFTGVFIVLSIISKYISMILIELQKRPDYIVKSIERMNNYTTSQKNNP
jgi:dolichol-phosphate mannosyltransferase